MFIYNHPSVAAQKAALAPGLYQGCAALYADESSNRTVLMAEYRASSERTICAVELILYSSVGDIEYRNFVRLTNGHWRNNHGEINQELSDFLPEDIENFRVFKNMKLIPQLIGTPIHPQKAAYLH